MQSLKFANQQTAQMQTKPLIAFRMGMSPQMIAHAKLLELSSADLKNELLANDNPALEVQIPDKSLSLESLETQNAASLSEESDYNSPVYDSESFRQWIQQTPVHSETLQEHLFRQVAESLEPASQKEVARLIISSLNADGFLPPVKEFREITKGVEAEAVKAALHCIRRLDPIGCATYTSIESLLVQAHITGQAPPAFEPIITYDFEALSKKRFAYLAKKYGITEAAAEAVRNFVALLHPIPGSGFASLTAENLYVSVDLIVKKRDRQLQLIQNEVEIPEAVVLESFKQFKQTQSLYEDAVGIREILRLRKLLLKLIGLHLIQYQRDFFLKGKAFLRSESQKALAGELKVSESTLSRILREKYIKTPWGIFPLQYFFSAGAKGGKEKSNPKNTLSKTALQERIVTLITDSEEGTRLSDQKIADKLSNEGFEISRRTVAKYRKELAIASSYDRK